MLGAGPPYPHPNPAPGSNAIGAFQIGVSPIGTIPPFDLWATVISQYANSQTLDSLLVSINAALDPTLNLDNFYDFIWNVMTAQGVGLDIWGRIVGVTRVVAIPAGSSFFGFNEASSWTGFGQGGFFSGQTITATFSLPDDQFRTLILAKAAANICDGSIPGINAVLLALFPHRGDCFVTDGQNMTMTFQFNFVLTAPEVAILSTPGILPKPVGVASTLVHL
jgi:hypothetical protein